MTSSEPHRFSPGLRTRQTNSQALEITRCNQLRTIAAPGGGRFEPTGRGRAALRHRPNNRRALKRDGEPTSDRALEAFAAILRFSAGFFGALPAFRPILTSPTGSSG